MNLSLSKRKLAVEEIILLKDGVEELSTQELKQAIDQNGKPSGVSQFTRKLIQKMESEHKHGNAQVYTQALSKLENHYGEGLTFHDINHSLLTSFNDRMTRDGMSINGISVYLRTLRSIFNKAIESDMVDRGKYPFHRFKIQNEKTIVRALSMDELQTLASLRHEPGTSEWKAKNLFLLSFALIGINFIDLCQLTKSHIQGDRVQFKRQKTGKVYSVKLTSLAHQILEEFAHEGHYLVQLLPDYKIPSSEVKRISKQQTKNTNKHLKRIGEELGFNLKLTTYVARHTWASTAKQLGYSNELIADAMGHSIGNSVTAIYLDNFSNEKIDAMNEEVSEIILKNI